MGKPMKISAGKLVDYYYGKDPLFGKENGDACTWVGTGAEKMGLTGKVDFDNLINLAHGYDKTGEERLVGKATGDQAHHLNASTDILLTIPKSVSIAGLNDEKLQNELVDTFSKTAEFAERFVKGRQTVDGVTSEVDGKMIGMLAIHSTTRNNDPHLHGHLNILNTTERPDSSFSTVENKEIFKNQGLIQQFQYNEVARVLTDNGFEIQLSQNKQGLIIPEIAGIPQDLKDLYSSRQNDIQGATELKEALQERMPGLNKFQIDGLIQLQTKSEKDSEISEADLRAGWKEKEQIAGFDVKQIISDARTNNQQQEKLSANEIVSLAISDVNKNESKFDLNQVMLNSLKLSVGLYSGTEIEKAIDNSIKTGELVSHGNQYSTPEMIKVESNIVSKLTEQKDIFTPLKTQEETKEAISAYEEKKGFRMSDGQVSAVALVLNSKDRLVLISGDAGSGKTTSFENIKDTLAGLESENFKIIGMSNDGKGSAQLQIDSKISSQTIASFLQKKDDPEEILSKDHRELWVVDEASKLGSRQLSQLLDRAETRNAQIVIVGDAKQIGSISAGKMFSEAQRLNMVEQTAITEVMRQRLNSVGDNQYAIDSAAAIRAKDPETALAILDKAGKITEIEDRDERLKYVAEKYVNHNDQKETALLVETNKDRTELLKIVREDQQLKGQIDSKNFTYISEHPVSLNNGNERFAGSYQPGNIITLKENMKIGEMTFKQGSKLSVTENDPNNRTISFTVNSDANNIKFNANDRAQLNDLKMADTTLTIDVLKNGDKLTLSELVSVTVSEKEQIILLKNDNTTAGLADNIKNGIRPTIEKIDFETGMAKLKMEDGSIIERNLNNLPSDNGQVITIDKSQGLTVDNAIALIDNANMNKFGVAITRHRFGVEVVTSDTENMQEKISHEQFKTSTTDGSIVENQTQQSDGSTPDKTSDITEEQNKSSFKEILTDSLETITNKLENLLTYCKDVINDKLFPEPTLEAATAMNEPELERQETLEHTKNGVQSQIQETTDNDKKQETDKGLDDSKNQENDDDDPEPEEEKSLKHEFSYSM